MSIIFCLVVLYFQITHLFVCEELSENFQINKVRETGLTYDTNYFIKLASEDRYLRYDGNDNGVISGLAYVTPQTDLKNSTDQSLIRPYIFVIERDINSMIKIKNIRTNRYISYYTTSSLTYFILSTSSSSASNNSLILLIQSSINTAAILSAYATQSYALYVSPYSYFTSSLWITQVSPTSASSRTELQFIAAPNITESPPQGIGDTNLTYGSNYFIRYASTYNYVRWDGNTNGEVSGLRYTQQNDITSIANETEKQAYLFVVEADSNNMIKLRNIRTNRYLGFNPNTVDGYVLSNYNTYLYSFKLLLNPATNSIYFAQSYSQSTYHLSSVHEFSDAFSINFIPRTSSAVYHFEFINSAQSPITSTTTTTTPTVTSMPTQVTTPTTTSTPTPTPCLPSNYIFRAVISSYEYDIPDPDVVDDRTYALILIPRTVINNTSPGSITEKIFYNENIVETYNWFFPSLNKLNVSIEQKRVLLPSIIRRNVAFKSNKEIIINNSLNSNNNIEIVYKRELSIDRTIEVKPRSSIDYILYADYITNLEIDFIALAKISGNDASSGKQLTGSELSDIFQMCANFTDIVINEKSIAIEVIGSLVAELISGFYFEVDSDEFE